MKQERKTVVMGPHILKINVSEVNNIFFTSDLHLNHSNIIKYCNRPFKDVQEMNKVLIDNLNETLSESINPILINCGDFIFSNVSTYDEIVNNINAEKIYNIIGNHDVKNVLQRRNMIPYNENSKVYWSTELIVQIYDDYKDKIILQFTVSHYPHCDEQFLGKFNIHGHLHTPKNVEIYTGTDANIAKKLKEKAMTYDVGVDGNDYKPVKLSDVLTGNLIQYQIRDIDFNYWKEKFFKNN
mgnify:CR=1 FL=1